MGVPHVVTFFRAVPGVAIGNHARRTRRATAVSNNDDADAKLSYLDSAALDFSKGIEAGLTPDEIVRLQMGVDREDELTDVQRRYKDQLIAKLTARAAEMKKSTRKCAEFEAGKAAYGRGAYPLCSELLEKAALENREGSLLGGDIRLWLALTYQALGRTEECVELFKRLESSHPNKKTRQQARDLLYIIEAPKLKLSEDERVKLPVLKDLDRPSARVPYSRSRARPASRQKEKRRDLSIEDRFWESYRPPIKVTNRYVFAAFVAISVCLAYYSAVYKSAS